MHSFCISAFGNKTILLAERTVVLWT